MDDATLQALRDGLPCPIPPHVDALHARGPANGPLESVDFGGVARGLGMEEIFPRALPMAHDGYGNYWLPDLTSGSTDRGRVFYACHDPVCRESRQGEERLFAYQRRTSLIRRIVSRQLGGA